MMVPWLSVIFYLLAFLGLTAYHVKQKKFAHGFYQFLATLLGFSILFYPLGYITVWNGSFGYAIHQTCIVFAPSSLMRGTYLPT